MVWFVQPQLSVVLKNILNSTELNSTSETRSCYCTCSLRVRRQTEWEVELIEEGEKKEESRRGEGGTFPFPFPPRLRLLCGLLYMLQIICPSRSLARAPVSSSRNAFVTGGEFMTTWAKDTYQDVCEVEGYSGESERDRKTQRKTIRNRDEQRKWQICMLSMLLNY